MPTAKHRISITADDELFEELSRLAKRRGRAVSGLTVDLVRRALELEEDRQLSRVADERLASGEKRIPHDRAWR